ncbi:thiamine phosphate synthase [Xylophilus sp.]|uniref:thiamine phosphate synthase n=1 Tax=Xylophilus sp. TaxID=2653893 RepID=UPI0013BE183E|nr:thiamine phosphate synthase [Xylophilus sp.]KAF1046952.1 MAG: Thiamine-phosphate synthase [Xylophilus sp.]
MTDPDIGELAAAIVEAHSGRFGSGWELLPAPPAQSDAPVYRAALQACSALGFIPIDAEVLARAWQRRSERTGRFDPAAWPDAPQDFGLRDPATLRTDGFPACPQSLGLYAVLPDAAWVGRMARAGVPTVQLRFKSDDAEAVKREVEAAIAAVAGTGAQLFINDHWRTAIAAGAWGVHLGQEDLDALTPTELAVLRASGVRLGVSTHGYAEMLRADAVAPSYVALGAVFPTTLKRMPTAPQGVGRLAAYARLLSHYPLVAIGGIDLPRFSEIKATGVGSIAVVRALVAADDPEAAAAQLQAALAS